MDATPFYDLFECGHDSGEMESILSGAVVTDALISRSDVSMDLTVEVKNPAPPVLMRAVEQAIAAEYGLRRVRITLTYGRPPESKPKKPDKAAPIFGKSFAKKNPTPIRDLTLEMGKVVVQGTIFGTESREIRKGNAYVLSFCLSDGTGSVRCNRFLKEPELISQAKAIGDGLTVWISGAMTFSKYDGENVLEPVGIVPGEKPVREDKGEKKRVELHLHTVMSAMDALCDTGKTVKRAISWGHPAIAITDHGVCQSFPDAMKAAGDKIKILYGVEGYYYNDVDDRLAALATAGPLDGEYVAFDIETTGLDSLKEAVTEIGAVRMKGGKELARFQTFADPGKPIPAEVVRLTGITDEDVKGAPSQAEAVRAFLDFAGDLPLIAHNAGFDVGFIDEICRRNGIPFRPRYVDTYAVSLALLPELRNRKLDTVAARLSLPEFRHHRASDDAVTAGLIHARFLEMLAEKGVTDLSQVQDTVQRLRNANTASHRPRVHHITLLAKTQAGIRNLYKLVTKSHLEYFHRNPLIPKSLLLELREGIVVGSACEAGEVFESVTDHRSRMEQQRLASFYDYLEIQPLANNRFMLSGERPRAKDEEELRSFNRRIVELGAELGKPVCATGDVHFLDPEDEIFRHVLLCAKEFEDGDKEMPLYFRTTDDMLEEFSYLGEEKAFEVVVTNTNLVADWCDTVRPLPPPVLYAPTIQDSDKQLQELVYGRMRELYGENPPEIITKRIETELSAILGRHYDVIYMSAQKLVADSLAHGYLVGSRGSVGSSLVAYMSGITEVNSLPAHYRCPKCKHTDFEAGKGFGCGADMPDAVCPVCGAAYAKEGFDIPFETFLGFGGDKVPDIDLNFSGEYQANAHKYTNELFGSDHVFRAGTIGTVAEKTAYGYVKKYEEKTGKTLSKAEETRLALGCVGVKRTTGQHPGGLVVIPQDKEIYDFCPAQHPADDAEGGIITTHFEYHCMEANLLKLDELGHDDPTMIKMLEDATGVNARAIPLDDPETKKIFCSPAPLGLPEDDPVIGGTGTLGIPEFGTGFTRQMLIDTQPKDFDTLVRLSGFSHGTDVWLGNAKDLITSGTASVKETVGCRDDIMIYLISKGLPEKRAFSFMESVRKGAIHKGKSWPEGIVEEMQAHGIPEWYIESCRKIQYLFPKAHAVAYVMMAFRIAWFKVHEPLAFYSAYFYRRCQKDNFDAGMMISGLDRVKSVMQGIRNNADATSKEEDLLTTLEACYEFYMRGFRFLPVDLYKSDSTRFIIEDGALRPPFVAISGLGEAAALDIVEHRKGRTFVSVEDLQDSCPKVSSAHIEQLRTLGALGDLPETSQLSFF